MRAGAFLEHRVEAVLLEHVHRGPRGGNQPVVFPGTEPQQLYTFFQSGVVQFGHMLLLPCRRSGSNRRGGRRRRSSTWSGGRRPTASAKGADQSGAENADVGKLIQMGNGD